MPALSASRGEGRTDSKTKAGVRNRTRLPGSQTTSRWYWLSLVSLSPHQRCSSHNTNGKSQARGPKTLTFTHGNAPQRKCSQDVRQDSLTPKSLLSTQLAARKSGPSLCNQGEPRQQETTPTGRRVVSLQRDPSGSELTNSLTAPSRHWSLPDVANAQNFIHPRITSDGAPTQNYIVQPSSATASKARLHCLLQAGGMAQKVKGLAAKSDVVTPWVPPDSCMLSSAFCTVVHTCSPACNR